MTSNFEFLKSKDKKLFGTIEDAEKLYRDGYFEQSIVQVRKFSENISKNVLGVRRTTEENFDDILATLKDILGENQSDKEFIDDLYFIKKQGNFAAHEGIKENAGNIALECLKRAFEVSINYAIKNNFANKKILNSHFSVDLLMTGKAYKFSEKYQEIRESENKEGIEEIVERAQAQDDEKSEKVIEADFKNKKVKPKKETKKEKPKKEKAKKDTKEPKEAKKQNLKINKDTILYLTIFGILFILFVSIMLFILPF